MKKRANFKNLAIYKNTPHKDKRGYFKELLKEKKIKSKFPFVVMSFSKRNVLRGLHIQNRKTQRKFVNVIKGKIFDVIIDLRKKSRTFGKSFNCILSEKNSKSLFIPPGFAHGFLALEKENYVIYSCTNYRDKKSEVAIKYNDKNLNIKWPSNRVMLSKKDKNAISFGEYKKKYL